jgi:hypothetical protein
MNDEQIETLLGLTPIVASDPTVEKIFDLLEALHDRIKKIDREIFYLQEGETRPDREKRKKLEWDQIDRDTKNPSP